MRKRFTPTLPREGEQLLPFLFLPFAAHEFSNLLAAPLTPLIAGNRSGLRRDYGSVYLLLRLSDWSALKPSPVGFHLLCPLLTSDVRSPLLAKRSVRVAAARLILPNTRQTSQAKFDNRPRTPAGFTAPAFDGWRTLRCSGRSSHRHCLRSDSCTSGRDFAPRCLQTPRRRDALALC